MVIKERASLSRVALFESLESRLNLTTISFASHDIDCCSAPEADSVALADIDGDGDTDIVASSRLLNQIAWYENIDGEGSFGRQRLIDSHLSIGPTIVRARDIDNDGDLDVVFGSFLTNRLSWYENVDGNGGFAKERLISNISRTTKSVSISDLDGDGDVDIITSSNLDANIIWYENEDARGAFGEPRLLTTDGRPAESILTTDVDSDGDNDIVASALFDSLILWYENTNGLAEFSEARVLTSTAEVSSTLTSADIDGDGDQDILSAATKINSYENLGQGIFGNAKLVSSEAPGAISLAFSDADADGDLDLFTASAPNSRLAWYENVDSEGSFGPQQIITNFADSAVAVGVADLDGDSDIDVVSASYGDSKVAWYENSDGQGVFGPQKTVTTEGFQAVASVDLDDDGDLDALSATGDSFVWYENINEQSAFSSGHLFEADIGELRSLKGGDLDGDGDEDVLAVGADAIVWFENIDSAGNFSRSHLIVGGIASRSAVLNDLDGDGDLDVLLGASSGSAWYANTDGKGNFQRIQTLSTGANAARSVVAADIDGDGDLDVLSANTLDDKITWQENSDGLGTFGEMKTIASSLNDSRSVAAGDIDGDGDLDVVAASFVNDRIVWYQNSDGKGEFGLEQVISADANGVFKVDIADIDGDNDQDVISSTLFGAQISWFENSDGLGTFSNEKTIVDVFSPTSFVVADLDNDDDNDVLFASDQKVGWQQNRLVADVNDDGVFNSSDLVRVFQSGEYEDAIARNSTFEEGDWNGDGEFDSSDLVIAFQAGHYDAGAMAAAVDFVWAEMTKGHRHYLSRS